MIQIIIADDHTIVRHGIRALLDKVEDIEVIGEAEDGHSAVELTESLEPDVLLMDIGMPRLNGIQALEKIQSLNLTTQIVILSMYSDETLIHQALNKGAKGYLLKDSLTEELLFAVRAANDNEIYLSPAISETVMEIFLNPSPANEDKTRYQKLTAREKEVLQLVAEGHKNNDIAEILTVSVKTVEKHRTNLMRKLKVHDGIALVRIAIKQGLIFVDS